MRRGEQLLVLTDPNPEYNRANLHKYYLGRVIKNSSGESIITFGPDDDEKSFVGDDMFRNILVSHEFRELGAGIWTRRCKGIEHTIHTPFIGHEFSHIIREDFKNRKNVHRLSLHEYLLTQGL